MPADTGMAFVVVTHLPSGHATTLPEILDRYTAMTVRNVENGGANEADHVYVNPADHLARLAAGPLLPQRLTRDGAGPANDALFRLLAEAAGAKGIRGVDAGGGRDGAMGIKAIKARGGLTLAQGPDGTGPRQSSMPETAIATGFVDLTLPVEEMAARLTEFARSHRDVEGPVGEERSEGE